MGLFTHTVFNGIPIFGPSCLLVQQQQSKNSKTVIKFKGYDEFMTFKHFRITTMVWVL